MEPVVDIRDRPRFEVDPKLLADWLTAQGEDRWWSVDGDPVLSGYIAMPCTADELADLLRRIDAPLLIHDPRERDTSNGQPLTTLADLDALCRRLGDDERLPEGADRPIWFDNRFFAFCWEKRGGAWLLIEDLETTADYASDMEAERAR